MSMTEEEFDHALNESINSDAVKATRRIFFNHLDESLEERGHFHVDMMYGAGSGLLIKKNKTFYLLTVSHVLKNATNFEFSNESPFWMTCASNKFGDKLEDFLMPGQLIHIGESGAYEEKNVDCSDLLLVELFYPFFKNLPDRYVDLDNNPDCFVDKQDFYDGMVLLAVGFPFEENNFEYYDEPENGFTHFTNINRRIVPGLCSLDGGMPHMVRFDGRDFPSLSGASGGVVTNVQTSRDEVKIAGVLVSASAAIVRFIPSYVVVEALSRLSQSKTTKVDPNFREPTLEGRDFLEEMARAMNNG